MAMRWDVCSPREYEQNGEVKTRWQRVGVAFEGEDGKPPRIILDALPLPGKDGQVKLMLFEPKENGESGGGSKRGKSAHGSTAKHHDDSGQVPF